MNRRLFPLMYFLVGIMLLLSWVQITLAPLLNFGTQSLGVIGGLAGIGFSLGTGFWLFTLYLERALSILKMLGWQVPMEDSNGSD